MFKKKEVKKIKKNRDELKKVDAEINASLSQLSHSQLYYIANKERKKPIVEEWKKNNPEKILALRERHYKIQKRNSLVYRETMKSIYGREDGGFTMEKFHQYIAKKLKPKEEKNTKSGDEEVTTKRDIFEEFEKIKDWKERLDFYNALDPEEKEEALGKHASLRWL